MGAGLWAPAVVVPACLIAAVAAGVWARRAPARLVVLSAALAGLAGTGAAALAAQKAGAAALESATLAATAGWLWALLFVAVWLWSVRFLRAHRRRLTVRAVRKGFVTQTSGASAWVRQVVAESTGKSRPGPATGPPGGRPRVGGYIPRR